MVTGSRDEGGPEPDSSERKRDARRQASAYQGASEAVFAILIAAGLGLWADSYFETSPRYLLLGTLLGFVAFVTRLVRLGRELNRPRERSADDE